MKMGLSKLLVVAPGLVLMAAVTASAQDSAGPIERALTTFRWESVEDGGVRVFYKSGSFAQRHRYTLLRSAQVAVREVAQCLGEEEDYQGLRLLYVDSREEMKELIGSPVTGFAVWSENGVFLVVNPEWRSFEKHEITHIGTMGVWGSPDPTSSWMIEGISISCDGWCGRYSVDEIAHHLIAHGEVPPLPEFFDNFRSLGEIRGGMCAASIIGFIRNTYGSDAVHTLWTDGMTVFLDSVDVTIEQLEALWRQYLERTAAGVEVDYEAIKKNGCG